MLSVRTLYRTGHGPSSSHTMGPRAAAERFAGITPGAESYRATLYGSLAATGKGHLTDAALIEALSPKNAEIVWKPEITMPRHPNAMMLEALDGSGMVISKQTVYSIGGGAVACDDDPDIEPQQAYSLSKMSDILGHVSKAGISFSDFVYLNEDSSSRGYFYNVWTAMQQTVNRGLSATGMLPGPLKLERKARSYYMKALKLDQPLKEKGVLFACALAAAEENAAGGRVTTAPTCGSSGVLPAVLFNFLFTRGTSDRKMEDALATAGLIGNLARTNASISGAEVGCQGEIGVACAMAAAAAAQIMGGSPAQIETAAEMGIEHHLGLTCDPVCGLVQIPCIERNAVAAGTALDLAALSLLSEGRHRVSFDKALETMLETGRDINPKYRETAKGGLAEHFLQSSR